RARDDSRRAERQPREAEARWRDHQVELKARLHRLVDTLDILKFLEEGDASRPPGRQVSLASSEEPGAIRRLPLRRRVPLPERSSEQAQPVTIGGAVYPLPPASI